MNYLRHFAAATFCIVAFPAYASEEVAFGPLPEWVVDFEPSSDAAFETDLPVYVRMTDFQTRLDADRITHFIAYDMEFRTPQGLSAGDLSLTWRPEFDELTVHHVLIERGDEVIDVLGEGQTFTILRREQNLDAATLTGVLTANMFPAGLEVGDVLKLAYTLSQSNPVLVGYPEASLGPLNGVVEQTHVRLSWPDDLELEIRTSDDLPALDRGRRNGSEYASLTMPMRDPLVPPAGAPNRYQLVRMFEASAFTGWDEVAHLFVPLYAEASQIAEAGPLRAELEKIRAASTDPVVRVEMALALVQDKVRYVALAMGAAGLVPADTATTWARRFGDCKAKTALLLGLLHELGIEADPILVSSSLGDALPQRLPMVGAFDHVLVRANIGGTEYFLDGTKTGETSLARLSVPYFVWGLPVIAGDTGLVEMVPAPLAEPNEDIAINIDASGGLRAPALAQFEAVFRGDDAIGYNAALSQIYGQQREQALKQFWEERYDDLTPEDVGMTFDGISGELRLTMTGSIEMDWDHDSFEPNGVRVGYTPDFSRVPGPHTDAPFAVLHPFYSRTSQTITLPDGFGAAQLRGENVEQLVAGLEYRREVALENNVFTSVRSTRSLAPEFAADEAAAAEQTLERLWDKRVFINIPDNYRLSQSEISAMARGDSDNVGYLIDQGVALMNAGEWAGARGIFDKVIALAPDDDWGFANRAVTLANLGQQAEARADIDAALAKNPDNFVAYHARGILASSRFEFTDAIEAYSRAIELEDDNVYALYERANSFGQIGQYDNALADARTLAEIEPDNPRGVLLQGYFLTRLKRGDEVLALFGQMIEQFPDDPTIPAAAGALLSELGMEAEGARFLSADVAGDDNPVVLMTRAMMRPKDAFELRLADLDQAIALEADFVPALLARADLLWVEYELERALSDISRVLELAPKSPDAYGTKVMILMDMEREREAVATVDTMVAAFSGDALALRVAAQYYRELEAWDKADRTSARARELLPEENYRRAQELVIRERGLDQ